MAEITDFPIQKRLIQRISELEDRIDFLEKITKKNRFYYLLNKLKLKK